MNSSNMILSSIAALAPPLGTLWLIVFGNKSLIHMLKSVKMRKPISIKPLAFVPFLAFILVATIVNIYIATIYLKTTIARNQSIQTSEINKQLTCEKCSSDTPAIILTSVTLDHPNNEMTWNLSVENKTSSNSKSVKTVTIQDFSIVGTDIKEKTGAVSFDENKKNYAFFAANDEKKAEVSFVNLIPTIQEGYTLGMHAKVNDSVNVSNTANDIFIPIKFLYDGNDIKISE